MKDTEEKARKTYTGSRRLLVGIDRSVKQVGEIPSNPETSGTSSDSSTSGEPDSGETSSEPERKLTSSASGFGSGLLHKVMKGGLAKGLGITAGVLEAETGGVFTDMIIDLSLEGAAILLGVAAATASAPVAVACVVGAGAVVGLGVVGGVWEGLAITEFAKEFIDSGAELLGEHGILTPEEIEEFKSGEDIGIIADDIFNMANGASELGETLEKAAMKSPKEIEKAGEELEYKLPEFIEKVNKEMAAIKIFAEDATNTYTAAVRESSKEKEGEGAKSTDEANKAGDEGTRTSGEVPKGTDETDNSNQCINAGKSQDEVCWDTSLGDIKDSCYDPNGVVELAYSYMKPFASKYFNLDPHTCNKKACQDCLKIPSREGDTCDLVAFNVCAKCCGGSGSSTPNSVSSVGSVPSNP